MYNKYSYSEYGDIIDCLHEFVKLLPATELTEFSYTPGKTIILEDSQGFYYFFCWMTVGDEKIFVGTILTDIVDIIDPFPHWRQTGLLGSEIDDGSGILKYVTYFPCLREFTPELYINYTDKILTIVTKTVNDSYCDISRSSMIYFGLSKLCTGTEVPIMGGVNCYKIVFDDVSDPNIGEEITSHLEISGTDKPKLIHPPACLYAPICFVRAFIDLDEIPDKCSVWVLPYYCKEFIPDDTVRKFQYCFVNYSVYTMGIELSTQGALDVGLPVYDDLYLGWEEPAEDVYAGYKTSGEAERNRESLNYETRDTPSRTVNTLNCMALIMPLYLYILREPESLETYSYICDLKFIGAVSLYNFGNGRRFQGDFPDRYGVFQCFYMETYRRAWGGITVDDKFFDTSDKDMDDVREAITTNQMWWESSIIKEYDAPFQRHFYGIAIKHDDDEEIENEDGYEENIE